jgi:aspartyl-tRNA(Asn)/glutamyl-tRNA(Gln) amidotransferase subunit A
LANLTGIPSISVPYTISNGLPIGMQLLAKHNDDKSLLQAARALETTVQLPEIPI